MRSATSIAIITLLAAAPVHAQRKDAPTKDPRDIATATALFDRGRELLKQHSYQEACAAFENSQQLDPQFGTLYNLAECSTQLGKLATAWLAYLSPAWLCRPSPASASRLSMTELQSS